MIPKRLVTTNFIIRGVITWKNKKYTILTQFTIE